jgi:epoxyqueuosine reductase
MLSKSNHEANVKRRFAPPCDLAKIPFAFQGIMYIIHGRKAGIIMLPQAMMSHCENIVKAVTKPLACCEVWTVSVGDLDRREAAFFRGFMPMARTAVVLGHHVVTEEEWQWYATEIGGERCAADDHAKEVCKALQQVLMAHGFSTEVVPYPGESGLQFRFVAQAASAGAIGMNAFLLHPAWGPWIHLRVLATEAPVGKKRVGECPQVCNACEACVSACPAGAIQDAMFDGLLCRSHRRAKGEYVPVGPQRELRWCTSCAQCCPIGDKPKARSGLENK